MGTRTATATATGLKWSAVGLLLVHVGLLFSADFLGIELSSETLTALDGIGATASALLGTVAISRLRRKDSPCD